MIYFSIAVLDSSGRSTAASIISMEDHSASRASTTFTAELTDITVTEKVPVTSSTRGDYTDK